MGNIDFVVKFEGDTLAYNGVTISCTKDAGIVKGVTVVYGPNGAGKTTVGNAVAKGRHVFNNKMSFCPENAKVKMLSFTSIYALTGIDVEHYTQRLEATANDFVPTVAEILGEKANSGKWLDIASRLGLRDMMEKKINYLSSGEMRKLLVANVLSESPDIIILDNPYIGLDAGSRNEFDGLIREIRAKGISVVMLVCDLAEVPEYADALIMIENRRLTGFESPVDKASRINVFNNFSDATDITLPERRSSKNLFDDHDVTFEIRNGHLRYGEKVILENFNWKIRRGECWALTGRNGSGKSLLLSMICADHPQAYSNDITLFDHRRGTGESIWDIKDAIGYLSPEMQIYFRFNAKVSDIVARGKRNSLTRSRQVTPEEREETVRWLDIMEIGHLSERMFNTLSNGEKQLVLLTSALIRQPRLLVLDEPFHGLDATHKKRLRLLIDYMVRKYGMSLIFVTHYVEELPECVNHIMDLSGCHQ